MELVGRIAVDAGNIAEDRRMLSCWQGSLQRRCNLCIRVGGIDTSNNCCSFVTKITGCVKVFLFHFPSIAT